MLLIEQALFLLCSQDAGVSALCGSRIYPGVLPMTATYPAVAYRVVDELHGVTLDGPMGLGEKRVRFFATSHGPTNYGQAKLLDNALLLAMNGFRGTISDESVSPVNSLFIQAIMQVEKFGFDWWEDKTQTHQIVKDYWVAFAEQQSNQQ